MHVVNGFAVALMMKQTSYSTLCWITSLFEIWELMRTLVIYYCC